MNYYALMVDVVKSRLYYDADREDIQHFVYQTIDTLNLIFKKELVKPVEFSAGDELQGLFSSLNSAYMYLRLLRLTISPVNIRASIGGGDWTVQIDKAGTTAQDGSAYHNARYALQRLEESYDYDIFVFTNNRSDKFLNALINSESIIYNSQTDMQREMMLLFEVYSPILSDEYANVDIYNYRYLLDIAYKKMRFNFYRPVSRRYEESLIDRFDFYNVDIEPTFAYDYFEADDIAIDTRRRKISSYLSQLIHTSRQNVEKLVAKGNIINCRNQTIAILNFMNYWR